MTMQASIGETVKFEDARVAQICGILVRIAIYPPFRIVRRPWILQEIGVFGPAADTGGAPGFTSGLPTPEVSR